MHHIYTKVFESWALISSVRLLEKNWLWLCLLSFALLWIRRWRQPAELITAVSVQRNLPHLPWLSFTPQAFFILALLFINVWLAQPVIPLLNETRTMETRDIFIAVDKSGSMDTIIKSADGQDQGRRIDAAAHAVEFFVARRKGDRIGLAVFDDKTYLHWPMTDDLQVILDKAQLIPKFVSGGTNIEGPKGPIQAVIDHWKVYGKAKTKVMILVSDGDAPLSPERSAELTKQMNALGGRLYLLGVGETWNDPNKTDATVEPLKKFVAALGGQVYSVADEKQMLDAVADIDRLEKSAVHVETSETYREVSIYFAFMSCICFCLFIISVAFTKERV